jgi:ferric-dicitrate binding protein FerR (iron transport regulator)
VAVEVTDQEIRAQASEWIERLKLARPEDGAAFRDWYLQSPCHIKWFLMMTCLDEELRQMDPDRNLPIVRDSASPQRTE